MPTDKGILTEVELELMTILWSLGEGSVRDVLAMLPKNRELAYTSVSTILRILEKKNILQTRKQGKGHIYSPLITKEEYEQKSLHNLVEKVFLGSPSVLMRRLIEDKSMSKQELKELKELLNNRLSE